MRTLAALMLLVLAAAAGVVDRVAVVVGTNVITLSEVLNEVRVTEFLAGEPLNLGPEQRQAAAQRLVDQQLIRNEMELSRFPLPSSKEADDMNRQWRNQHFPNEADFSAALEKHGITEEQLKQHLLWQLGVLRFTDARFRQTAAAVPAQTADRLPPEADRSAPRDGKGAADMDRNAAGSSGSPAGVDEQMDAWLKEVRGQTRVVFKKEALE
jgi:hypothetical protein